MTGVASYEIWLADQTTNTHVTYANLTGTSWQPPQPLVLGDNYTWWVAAVAGQTYAWSDPSKFTIRPTASGPSGDTATNLPTFAWNNVTGATSYEIWLTDQTTNTHVTYANLTGTTWQPSQPLILGDNYTWWIGAVHAGTIGWSTPLSFVIRPTAITPIGTIASDLPTFTWSSVVGASSYEIWLTDQTTNAVVKYTNLTGTAFTPTTPLVMGDKYIWWVGAVSGKTVSAGAIP